MIRLMMMLKKMLHTHTIQKSAYTQWLAGGATKQQQQQQTKSTVKNK